MRVDGAKTRQNRTVDRRQIRKSGEDEGEWQKASGVERSAILAMCRLPMLVGLDTDGVPRKSEAAATKCSCIDLFAEFSILVGMIMLTLVGSAFDADTVSDSHQPSCDDGWVIARYQNYST